MSSKTAIRNNHQALPQETVAINATPATTAVAGVGNNDGFGRRVQALIDYAHELRASSSL